MADVFARIVCGVDGSEPGTIAARRAAELAAPHGELTLVAVEDEVSPLPAAAALDEALAAIAGLHEAGSALGGGDPATALLAEARRRRATLLAVGSRRGSRAAGIALGSVATFVLHEARCSVLAARGDAGRAWPRSIVVGVDGSAGSAAALRAALALGARAGASVTPVVATGDRHVELDAVRALAGEVEEHAGGAVDALAVASEHADLVVVGSRGLRGIRAFASVGERLGHEARCSVLVVRDAGRESPADTLRSHG